MAEASRIEWTDATWNPITGCSLVSEGCRHCYAARLAATRLRDHPSRAGLARLNAKGEAKFTGEVRLNREWLDQPLRWRRPRRIFVCAHGDLFHENVPDEWIDRVFAVMALAPQHVFQVLTKRPERMRAYIAADRCDEINAEAAQFLPWDAMPELDVGPLRNVWVGTSVEDQLTADARIPHLLATPAAVRFVSAEPLLGPVDLDGIWGYSGSATADQMDNWPVHWIIVGGESGPGARPMHPDWARSLRDQCAAAGVAFFFKQWGEWGPERPSSPSDLVNAKRQLILSPCGNTTSGLMAYPPEAWLMTRAGKTAAGRLLDGRTHDAMPDRVMQ